MYCNGITLKEFFIKNVADKKKHLYYAIFWLLSYFLAKIAEHFLSQSQNDFIRIILYQSKV